MDGRHSSPVEEGSPDRDKGWIDQKKKKKTRPALDLTGYSASYFLKVKITHTRTGQCMRLLNIDLKHMVMWRLPTRGDNSQRSLYCPACCQFDRAWIITVPTGIPIFRGSSVDNRDLEAVISSGPLFLWSLYCQYVFPTGLFRCLNIQSD